MKKPVQKFLATGLMLSSFAFASDIYVQKVAIKEGMTHQDIIDAAARVVPTPQQLEYHQEEFIAFIHFGINTFTGREWGNGKEDPKLFNPEGEVDTDQWVRVMKEAGMKKVVITVKHHDGFCTWQTRYNDKFSVKASPWKDGKGDVLRLLSDSCKKYGLKLGVYLSPADLYQIENKEGLYGNLSKYQDSIIPTDPASFKTNPMKRRDDATTKGKPSFKINCDDYNRYMLNQIYETLTEYGEIHELWFDGAHPKRKGGQKYVTEEWMRVIRTLAPNAVVFGGGDVRWVGNEHGGTRKNEWNVIASFENGTKGFNYRGGDLGSDKQLPKSYEEAKKKSLTHLHYSVSEVDTSIRNGWFWRNDTEQRVKSADWAFDVYERSAGGNAVFLLNTPPNRYGKLSPRDVKMLTEVGRRIESTYGEGKDLAEGSTVSVANLRDQDLKTVWQADSNTGEFTVKLKEKSMVNRFSIQEGIVNVGQRVKDHAVDAFVDGEWQEVSRHEAIGYKRTHRFADVYTDQFRVRILDSRLKPAIAEVAAYYYDAPPAPVYIKRDSSANIILEAKESSGHGHPELVKDAKIYYTLDGSTPTEKSTLYTKPFSLPNGGTINAVVIKKGVLGSVNKTVLGLAPKGWTITSSTEHNKAHSAAKAMDGDTSTFWHSKWSKKVEFPHTLTIDLKEKTTIGGFFYLPRQDRNKNGMVEAWEIEASLDGKTWTKIAEGEFGNLINDPSGRPFYFDKAQSLRYFRFVSKRAAQNLEWSAAAELQLLPAQK